MEPSRHRGYLSFAVEPADEWVSCDTEVEFKGHRFLLKPGTREFAPTIVIPPDVDLDEKGRWQLALEFLSAMAWIRKRGFHTSWWAGGADAPVNLGRSNAIMLSDAPLDSLPEPTEVAARKALASYREALAVNLTPYKFLGFYKVIDALHRDSKPQIDWINETIDLLPDGDGRRRAIQLAKEQRNVGKHLYRAGRCAVAHAYDSNTVNPDEPSDIRRLIDDLPLIKALAEHAIEHEYLS